MTTHEYIRDSVVSADGTTISYRQLGDGPGLVLVHGAMQASQNFMDLGAALADSFTVYIPDRRGRRSNEPPRDDYSIQNECDDLDALLQKTGAHNVFGLSSGAVIALRAALTLPAVHKIAVYEPPLFTDRSNPTHWASRYEREISQGRLADAFVTVGKGTGVLPGWLRHFPRFLLVPLLRWAIKRDEKETDDDDVPIRDLIPTMRYDLQFLERAHLEPQAFEDLSAEVLLLRGSNSPTYLRETLDELSTVLPKANQVELADLDHLGPDNEGEPKHVADELKRFFA